FFLETGGYNVCDDANAAFLSAFERWGLQRIGYPVSRRYTRDGFTHQAFQKAIMQVRHDQGGRIVLVNIFDDLSRDGFDQRLLETRQTPLPLPGDPPGTPFEQVISTRQAYLNARPALRSAYFSISDPLTFFGLPTSQVQDMGNHYAIRLQRAVLQEWKENVPWARIGEVTIANGGDIAKELGGLPADAIVPEARPGAAARWGVRTLLVGPGTPGRLYALQVNLENVWRHSIPQHARIMISDDSGARWREFPGGLPVSAACMRNLNMDYATIDALYASTCQGLYRWSGGQWTLVSPQLTWMVAVVYGRPEVIWATEPFGPNGVIRSEDGGKSWTPASSGLISFNGVATIGIDPRDAGALYAIIWPKYGGSYLRRGTPGGEWVTMPTPGDSMQIEIGMAIDGATGTLYVTSQPPGGGTVQALWRTTNPREPDLNAVRWEMVSDFGPGVTAEVLAAGWSPQGLALYVAVTPSGSDVRRLYRSPDGGRTWHELVIP
ncbi:MAG TPA: hypothetical protein VER55_16610, partial [Ardenticatenaceae bacterium]|nr:hypothetical protein [Ardenticatenaceae bacterium]